MNKDIQTFIKILRRTIMFFLSLIAKWEKGEDV